MLKTFLTSVTLKVWRITYLLWYNIQQYSIVDPQTVLTEMLNQLWTVKIIDDIKAASEVID